MAGTPISVRLLEEVGWSKSIDPDVSFQRYVRTTRHADTRSHCLSALPMAWCITNGPAPIGHVGARIMRLILGTPTTDNRTLATSCSRPTALLNSEARRLCRARVAIKTITDGTSHTLMMAEVRSIKEFGNTWGGTISEIETALGGQTFEADAAPQLGKGRFCFSRWMHQRLHGTNANSTGRDGWCSSMHLCWRRLGDSQSIFRSPQQAPRRCQRIVLRRFSSFCVRHCGFEGLACFGNCGRR